MVIVMQLVAWMEGRNPANGGSACLRPADVAPHMFHLQFYSQSTNMRQQQELTPKNRKTNVFVSMSRAANDRFDPACTAVALPTFNRASSVGCVGTHASVHTFQVRFMHCTSGNVIWKNIAGLPHVTYQICFSTKHALTCMHATIY